MPPAPKPLDASQGNERVKLSDFFSDFVTGNPVQLKALDAVMAWVKQVHAGGSVGLVLWSTDFGVGKTHLMTAAKAALAYSPQHGTMMTAPDFISTVKGTYKREATRSEDELFRQWRTGYVMLDDVGKEYIDGKAWGDEKYFLLVDGVVKSKKSIMVTSNLDTERLAERMGGAAWSRLYGLCGEDGFINMSSLPDYRFRSK